MAYLESFIFHRSIFVSVSQAPGQQMVDLSSLWETQVMDVENQRSKETLFHSGENTPQRSVSNDFPKGGGFACIPTTEARCS